jgi:hypothetical protein
MVLLNRTSLRPGLLCLILNLALIIQCLSRNNIYIYIFFFFKFYIPELSPYCSRVTPIQLLSPDSLYTESVYIIRSFSRQSVHLLTSLQQIFRLISARPTRKHRSPLLRHSNDTENTVPLFFHCFKRNCCDCVTTTVGYRIINRQRLVI